MSILYTVIMAENELVEKHNKKLLFAFILLLFGVLLFIALAMTLP